MKKGDASAVGGWCKAVVICGTIARMFSGDCSAFSSSEPSAAAEAARKAAAAAQAQAKADAMAKSSQGGATAAATPSGPKRTPPPKYFDRYIRSPEIVVQDPETGATQEWDFAEHRFSFVIVLASWNLRSTEIVNAMKPHLPELLRRQVGFVGVASHDSAIQLAKWRKENSPGFTVGLADMAFIKAWANPKVPTVWIVSQTGNILQRMEMPSDEFIVTFLRKLSMWTDF